MPDFFYLLIEYPTLIAIPIVFFAALAIWSRSRTAWVATAAWAVYLVYELGMSAGVFWQRRWVYQAIVTLFRLPDTGVPVTGGAGTGLCSHSRQTSPGATAGNFTAQR